LDFLTFYSFFSLSLFFLLPTHYLFFLQKFLFSLSFFLPLATFLFMIGSLIYTT
jgi:hypothetical protein